jgi:hypothetical protein
MKRLPVLLFALLLCAAPAAAADLSVAEAAGVLNGLVALDGFERVVASCESAPMNGICQTWRSPSLASRRQPFQSVRAASSAGSDLSGS